MNRLFLIHPPFPLNFPVLRKGLTHLVCAACLSLCFGQCVSASSGYSLAGAGADESFSQMVLRKIETRKPNSPLRPPPSSGPAPRSFPMMR